MAKLRTPSASSRALKARQGCELPYSGWTDWRLPTVYELLSLIHFAKEQPPLSYFPDIAQDNTYWSASATFWDAFFWTVNFLVGTPIDLAISDSATARCVRFDQNEPTDLPRQRYFYAEIAGESIVFDTRTNLLCRRRYDHLYTQFFTIGLSFCEGSDYAGLTNWRVPNIVESLSIFDSTRWEPVVDVAVFPQAASDLYPLCSSSTHYFDTEWIFALSLSDGSIVGDSKGLTPGTCKVWCVADPP